MPDRHYRKVDFSSVEGRIDLYDQMQTDASKVKPEGLDTSSFRIILRRPHTEAANKETRTFQNAQSFAQFLLVENYGQKWLKIAAKGYVVEIGIAKFRGEQFMGWNERYKVYTYEQMTDDEIEEAGYEQ